MMIHFALEQSYTLCETRSLLVEGRKRLFQSCQSLPKQHQMEDLVDQVSTPHLQTFTLSLSKSHVPLSVLVQSLSE